jgi:hypothetical protein
MRELAVPPFAPAMLDSMRAIGYSFEAALADIVDNSISAGATHVDIQFRTSKRMYVAVMDDGAGMPAAGLVAAMRHGGVGPIQRRSERDLGRFGLGLKTASLSQCRTLTVVTKRSRRVSAAAWDLDLVAKRKDWILALLDREEWSALPHFSELKDRPSGTIVIWEHFDRALAGEVDPGKALERLVDKARNHLALAFHRFLSDDARPVVIGINNQTLPPVDPFLSTHRSTRQLPAESIKVARASVQVRPFLLPHISKLSRRDLELAGGEEGLRLSQGFYVYRARRLITHGTWFRLLSQRELTKLARVQVDVPNTLDHLWALDVKKSTAYPPDAVRRALQRTIGRIAGESRTVYAFRGRRISEPGVEHLWERVDVRDGYDYSINREHSAIRAAGPIGGPDGLEEILKAIEMALPVDSIYQDMASDRSVQPAQNAGAIEATLENLARRVLRAVPSDLARDQLLDNGLLQIDIFAAYPETTKTIIARLKRDDTG